MCRLGGEFAGILRIEAPNDREQLLIQSLQALNSEGLETECFSAPMSGERTFKATARLQMPESCPIAKLRSELEDIGGELMVDILFAED